MAEAYPGPISTPAAVEAFMRAIARAEVADPGNDFVATLKRRLPRRGYLTESEFSSLARVAPSYATTRPGWWSATPSQVGRPSMSSLLDDAAILEDAMLDGSDPVVMSLYHDHIYDMEGGNMQSFDWAGGE